MSTNQPIITLRGLKKSYDPFAKAHGVAREARKGVAGFLFLIIPGILGLVHLGLTFVPYGALFALPFIAVLIWPLARVLVSTRWEMVKPI
jgi:hypothetical protein